jgi:hypothetical protein
MQWSGMPLSAVVLLLIVPARFDDFVSHFDCFPGTVLQALSDHS